MNADLVEQGRRIGLPLLRKGGVVQQHDEPLSSNTFVVAGRAFDGRSARRILSRTCNKRNTTVLEESSRAGRASEPIA
jgi:hypothetical protein